MTSKKLQCWSVMTDLITLFICICMWILFSTIVTSIFIQICQILQQLFVVDFFLTYFAGKKSWRNYKVCPALVDIFYFRTRQEMDFMSDHIGLNMIRLSMFRLVPRYNREKSKIKSDIPLIYLRTEKVIRVCFWM